MIDQDALVRPAKRIKRKGSLDIIARPLANGDTAICFFNKSGKRKPIEFELDSLGEVKYLNFAKSPEYEIHDLWSDKRENGDTIKTTVERHGVKVYRISPQQF